MAVVEAYVDKGIVLSTAGAEDSTEPQSSRFERPGRGGSAPPGPPREESSQGDDRGGRDRRQMGKGAADVRCMGRRVDFAQEVYLEACPKGGPGVGWREIWLVIRHHAAARRAFFRTRRQEKGAMGEEEEMRTRHALTAWKARTRPIAPCNSVEAILEGAIRRRVGAYQAWVRAGASGASRPRSVSPTGVGGWRSKRPQSMPRPLLATPWSLWRMVRRVAGRRARKGPTPVAVIHMDDGAPAASPHEVAEVWLQKCAEEFGHNVEIKLAERTGVGRAGGAPASRARSPSMGRRTSPRPLRRWPRGEPQVPTDCWPSTSRWQALVAPQPLRS